MNTRRLRVITSQLAWATIQCSRPTVPTISTTAVAIVTMVSNVERKRFWRIHASGPAASSGGGLTGGSS